MTAKKLFYAILFLSVLLFAFSSCSGGEELARIEGSEYTYVLYGSPNAITKISLVAENGEIVGEVDAEYRVNEPWLGEDKQNYGFELVDLNGDGLEDFVIKTVRTVGAERYHFYINEGNASFRLEKKLSGAAAPVFGDGTVCVKTSSRIDEPTYNNEPSMYELRVDETVYGWSEHGRLEVKCVNRFSYFSETDIYRYTVYLPNEDGELEADSDKWIYPDKLGEYGFEPLE